MEDLSKGYESNYVAYEAQANGNCFFNSLSICLYGNPGSAYKLRVLTLKYIVRNFYVLPDDFPNEGKVQTLKACMNLYGWSNPLTIYCAAHALSITINLARPQYEGMCNTNLVKCRRSFGPVGRRITEVIILYTSSQSPFKDGKLCNDWSPNHYIPLLRRVVNVTESVSSVDYICISDDEMSFDKTASFAETNENFNENVNETVNFECFSISDERW